MRACLHACTHVCSYACTYVPANVSTHTPVCNCTRGTPVGVLIVLILGDCWYHCVPLRVRARVCVRARV